MTVRINKHIKRQAIKIYMIFNDAPIQNAVQISVSAYIKIVVLPCRLAPNYYIFQAHPAFDLVFCDSTSIRASTATERIQNKINIFET